MYTKSDSALIKLFRINIVPTKEISRDMLYFWRNWNSFKICNNFFFVFTHIKIVFGKDIHVKIMSNASGVMYLHEVRFYFDKTFNEKHCSDKGVEQIEIVLRFFIFFVKKPIVFLPLNIPCGCLDFDALWCRIACFLIYIIHVCLRILWYLSLLLLLFIRIGFYLIYYANIYIYIVGTLWTHHT